MGPSAVPVAVQFVGYETADSEDRSAALLLASDDAIERVSLAPGLELEYSLGDRRCAGRLDGDRHEPCDRTGAPYCDRHTDRWPCARCQGECSMPVAACHEEHAIYLAAFAPDTFKVGVTRRWRLETRLREQGADRAAHIRTVEDGRIARRIEADIAADLTDRVRVPRKVRGLHLSVDEAAWESLLAAYDPIETYDFEYGLALADRPMAETIASGMVLATKGRMLVLEKAGSTYAVDMRDLVGHEVTPGGLDRSLQSTFGVFKGG